MNRFGRLFGLSLFGESHGPGVGVVLDGVPAGLPIDTTRIQADLDARKPGTSLLVTQRNEEDRVEVLSGIYEGRATGTPLALWIRNEDAQSKPYEGKAHLPRPGHADFPNRVWSGGANDPRGGGHSSGRLTAPIVAAGSIAQMILDAVGIRCGAHLDQVGEHAGPSGPLSVAAMTAAPAPLRTAHAELAKRFEDRIETARKAQDSVGGAVAFAAEGVPVGFGAPFFDSLESQLAHLLFSVPAVKAVEFGAGMRAATMAGSKHNDLFVLRDGAVATSTNHSGGILGGRSTGMPIWGRVAIKPSSSIAQPQQTVDLDARTPATVSTTGRHDPCIAIRAVPVVQACLRIVLADALLLARSEGHA